MGNILFKKKKKLSLKIYIPNYMVIVGKNVLILRFSGLYAWTFE